MCIKRGLGLGLLMTCVALPVAAQTALPNTNATALPNPNASALPNRNSTALPNPTPSALPNPAPSALPDASATVTDTVNGVVGSSITSASPQQGNVSVGTGVDATINAGSFVDPNAGVNVNANAAARQRSEAQGRNQDRNGNRMLVNPATNTGASVNTGTNASIRPDGTQAPPSAGVGVNSSGAVSTGVESTSGNTSVTGTVH